MRAAVIGSVLAILVAIPIDMSSADPMPDPTTDAGVSNNGLWVDSTRNGDQPPQQGWVPGTGSAAEPAAGGFACQGAEQVAGEFVDHAFCTADRDDLPAITAADVQRAFAELKLPAGTLTIQPPDGLTLVNFKTNFYTTSTTPISTSLTLLGQQVTLEATPASFAWNFGDGKSTSTTEPGAPYPDLTITHSYLRKGDYLPSLSTTYTGRYRIATGPWQTIPGTVTIDGPGQPLQAVEAQPKLVGY
ncbi:PKD domain-containing protein [Nocardioides carbamazepini]|uniref:PKD domain-containing protein n=1 Tax=Nocardioides carbamazepini TaxID=2854259 RepID=UPI00214A114D|nr:PKD domain-containing protein [Nocardioides carbamazepini]MCR1784138.1 PKD domain-containing protein [Nocardioides carbamazepini]